MRLCTQTLPFQDPLEEVLAYLGELGVDAVDLKVTGDHPASIHPDDYVDDPDAQADLVESVEANGLEIGVLGAGGTNPLHPDTGRAADADSVLRSAIELADQLGVDTVTSFSGLPGGSPTDETPNWITAVPPFPELAEARAYQWDEVTVPYWRDLAGFADDHGVDVAIEIHINTIVSSPWELVQLRDATNDRIGGYIDPGHLHLQNIDPIAAVRFLAEHDANHHFEISDVRYYDEHMRVKGTTDMTPPPDHLDRAWDFCTAGYGEHDENDWRRLIATLDLVGYDRLVSIQEFHTPAPFPKGLERAVDLVNDMLL